MSHYLRRNNENNCIFKNAYKKNKKDLILHLNWDIINMFYKLNYLDIDEVEIMNQNFKQMLKVVRLVAVLDKNDLYLYSTKKIGL